MSNSVAFTIVACVLIIAIFLLSAMRYVPSAKQRDMARLDDLAALECTLVCNDKGVWCALMDGKAVAMDPDVRSVLDKLVGMSNSQFAGASKGHRPPRPMPDATPSRKGTNPMPPTAL